MLEGPSIVILSEEAAGFAGHKVLRVRGNSTEDIERMRNRKLVALRSWGKHFLLEFEGFGLRIHFMLFGSYRIALDTNQIRKNPVPPKVVVERVPVLDQWQPSSARLQVPIHRCPSRARCRVRSHTPGRPDSSSGVNATKRTPSKRARPDCVPTQV